MPAPSRPLWQGRMLALVGIVLLAFSLRSAVAALSPLLTIIAQDFAVEAWVAGLIGTAPPVCFAISGVLTPALERRFGLERLTTVALVVAALATIFRALVPDAAFLLGATALMFAAVGVANVLLPPLVKTYFPDRIGAMTAIYTTVMAVATFVPPLLAVPVADAAGWRVSMGMWAVFSLVAIVPWVAMSLRARAHGVDLEEPNPSVFGRMLRLPLAWAMVITFAASSATAYTSFMWLPKMLTESAGVTAAQAGALLSLFAAMGLPGSLFVPILVTRFRRVGTILAVSIAAAIIGLLGLIFVPATATWLWVMLLGFGPFLFPLVLVLMGVRTQTREASVALSGFTQSAGYAIAAVTPLLAGILHDVTDGWAAPMWMLLVFYLAVIPAAIIASRPGTIESQWERKHGTW